MELSQGERVSVKRQLKVDTSRWSGAKLSGAFFRVQSRVSLGAVGAAEALFFRS